MCFPWEFKIQNKNITRALGHRAECILCKIRQEKGQFVGHTDTHTPPHPHRQTDAENLSEYYTLQNFAK